KCDLTLEWAAQGGGGVTLPEVFKERLDVALVWLTRNKRRIMRIFTLPPTAETPPEPNFYDSMKKIRLRQQLEMYSIARKYEQQQQQPPKQTESVQLSVE
uniref:Small integral membrane protein 19 n=1 Tax=Serinus canaria TaxID=9135 RepID=A0A8C9NC29_SERCA